MDLNKLRIFKCVADLGGINAAASELKIRQSSISLAMSSLESELGYKILQRHYRGMNMTVMGKLFYEFSRKTLADYDDLLKKTSTVTENAPIEGTVTIATSFGISASDWFIRKISEIMEKYPNLLLRIINYREGDSDIILSDIIICPFISGRSDLVQKKMECFDFRLFASTDYIKKFGLPKNYDDLDHHNLVSFSKELRNPFNEADSLLHKGCSLGKSRKISLEINNSIGLLKIIKEGYGIASLPVEEGLEEGLIPILDDVISQETCFVTRKTDQKNSNIEEIKYMFFK